MRYIALHHVVMSYRTGPQGEEFDFRRNVDVTAAGMGARVSCSSNDNNDKLDLKVVLFCPRSASRQWYGTYYGILAAVSKSNRECVSAYVPE